MTVTGPVSVEDLGIVLPHEHVQLDLYRTSRSPDGYLNDLGLAIEELRAYAGHGGRTVVDLTSLGLGRDPEMLVDVARQTGLNVVMGCGHYRNPFIDPAVEKQSVAFLTEQIVQEIQDGVGETGIRPGVIGECGIEREWVSPLEERTLRAAGRAQVISGLPLSVHATRTTAGLECLSILEEERVDLTRVVLSHCDNYPDGAFHRAVAERGAFVEFDRHSPQLPWEQARRVANIRALADAGYLDHVLISQDICHKSERAAYGGPGYSYVLTDVVPMLRSAGFSPGDVDRILVGNTHRWLAAGEVAA